MTETEFHQGVECVVKMEREKQKIGHWIYWSESPFRWECDKCGGLFKTDFNFCPNCGDKKMEGEK